MANDQRKKESIKKGGGNFLYRVKQQRNGIYGLVKINIEGKET